MWVRGTCAWSGLIPWFSKTDGNTYATLLHHPFLFKGKPTHAQEVALFAILKSAKVEIKKEHQVLMVNMTTSFKTKGKGKERELQEELQASFHALEEAQSWTKA